MDFANVCTIGVDAKVYLNIVCGHHIYALQDDTILISTNVADMKLEFMFNKKHINKFQ